MGRFFTLTNSKKSFNGFERRRTISVKKGAGPVSLKFITIAILAALTLLYLGVANGSATKGYSLKALEEEKTKIEAQNERLEVEAARQKSLKEIENKNKDSGMVPVTNVEFE
ncbi:MAG: hypothetical protein NT039_03715 [Candidatus Berkelbacteria bacterium]|nr:hypothetical protein [Candidatus Berkelbacteria bacterium]